jgi:hypothetical protein
MSRRDRDITVTETSTVPDHPSYRAQYRPRGSSHWCTYSERPTGPAAIDDILTADLPPGAAVRVIPVPLTAGSNVRIFPPEKNGGQMP